MHFAPIVDSTLMRKTRPAQRDLHQTIMVHNHNADLMADHKAWCRFGVLAFRCISVSMRMNSGTES